VVVVVVARACDRIWGGGRPRPRCCARVRALCDGGCRGAGWGGGGGTRRGGATVSNAPPFCTRTPLPGTIDHGSTRKSLDQTRGKYQYQTFHRHTKFARVGAAGGTVRGHRAPLRQPSSFRERVEVGLCGP
jgi:hypothetical protein